MKLSILLLLFLFMKPVQAGWNNWSETDRKLFVASSIAITADWATTRYASTRWSTCNCWELNPILGRYPSRDTVDAYFVTMLVTNYFIGDILPEKYRGVYFIIRTGSHGHAAVKNYVELGWKVRF